MVPTRRRGAPAVLVEHAGEMILVDCGEGTQRQMNIAGKSRARIRKILLTHWHGDHVGGLAPLLQTLFNSPYEGTLELWGPLGTRKRLEHLSCAMEMALDRIRVTELEPPLDSVQVFWTNEAYQLACAPMRHGILTVAYAIEEHGRRRVDMERAAAFGLSPGPLIGHLQRGEAVEVGGRVIRSEDVTYWQAGRKLALVTDTTPTPEIVDLARGADAPDLRIDLWQRASGPCLGVQPHDGPAGGRAGAGGGSQATRTHPLQPKIRRRGAAARGGALGVSRGRCR